MGDARRVGEVEPHIPILPIFNPVLTFRATLGGEPQPLHIRQTVALVPNEFQEKIRSIQWGVSAQNPGTRKNYYDADALADTFGGQEAQEEYLDAVEGVPLKWDKGVPYNKDKAGDYVRSDERTLERVLYGKPEKETRSFGFSAGRDSG